MHPGSVQRGFHLSVCLSLAGRPWAFILVKEQSRHFRQSGEGGRSDPVSGCAVFWACMVLLCWICSMFAAHGGAGEVKGAGVAWSGDEEAEEALNSSSQLIEGGSKGGRAELIPGVLQPCHQEIYSYICLVSLWIETVKKGGKKRHFFY